MTTPPLVRILYVEDDADIREIGLLALHEVGGFLVESCSSGEEALRQAPLFRPDLILLEVMMPGMDGPATLQALRAIPAVQEVPIVFVTAKVQPGEIRRYRSEGALEVIPKPFDPMTISDTLQGIWERFHAP